MRTSQRRQKLYEEYETILLAFHEASHIVIGLFNNVFVNKAKIYSDKYLHGYTYYSCKEILSKKSAVNLLLFLKAGIVGETYIYKINTGISYLPKILRNYSYFDFKEIKETIRKYNLPKSKAFIKKINKKVLQQVQKLWDDISRISHYLFKYKTISFFKIKQILLSGNNKHFWLENKILK